MKAVKKFLFAVSISLALALTGVANTQGFGQDRKPKDPVKEKQKPDSKKEEKKNEEKENDGKKGGNRKKPSRSGPAVLLAISEDARLFSLLTYGPLFIPGTAGFFIGRLKPM